MALSWRPQYKIKFKIQGGKNEQLKERKREKRAGGGFETFSLARFEFPSFFPKENAIRKFTGKMPSLLNYQ